MAPTSKKRKAEDDPPSAVAAGAGAATTTTPPVSNGAEEAEEGPAKAEAASSKWTKTAWTPDQDKLLGDLVTEHTHGRKRRWGIIYEEFEKVYPGEKSMKALTRRYENALHGLDVELNDQEKEVFKKCVRNVDSGRMRIDFIAWHFSNVSKKEINKTAAAKLVKAMKNWEDTSAPAAGDAPPQPSSIATPKAKLGTRKPKKQGATNDGELDGTNGD